MRSSPNAIVVAVTLFAVALLTEGCGQKTAATPPGAKARDSVAKQLTSMTPEQRADYMRKHPEALSALSGNSRSGQ